MISEIWIQIKVLMWKCFIFRKRSPFISLMEIFFPIMAFFIATRKLIKSVDGKDEVVEYGNNYSTNDIYRKLKGKYGGSIIICYAPKTGFSSELMNKARVKLGIAENATKSFDSESSLLQYYNSQGNEDVRGIIFRKIKGDKRPEHLNYVIVPSLRGYSWNLKELFYYSNPLAKDIRRPGESPYLTLGFLPIQLAVDTSYIEIVSSANLKVDVYMQELPVLFWALFGRKWRDHLLYAAITVYGFLPTAVLTMGRVAEEKSSGVKELMKMMGLKSWMLWSGWFLNAFSCMLVSVVWIVIDFVNRETILYCSASLFTIFLLLYCAAGIMFCFAITTLFYKPQILAIFGVIAWCLSYHYSAPQLENVVTDVTRFSKFMCMLLPNGAVYYGFRTIALYERQKVNLNLANIYKSADGSNEDITMGNVLWMLLFDIVLYMTITFYFDSIYPGPYGVGKSFGFPITYLQRRLLKTNNRVQHQEEAVKNTHDEFSIIEPAPDLKPGIQIRNLHKRYGNINVVNGFSMDIYEQQITVLLGHNGAGKTTTLNIVTGMCGPTSGTVFIGGLDIASHMDEVRFFMGFCTQHNLHFSTLTVMEHIQFFGMLKGLSFGNATAQAKILLKEIKLYEKRNLFASALSGGMKRRLSLGIALIGNPKVIILDEPTSGLDPEVRREIWDTLLAMRGSRTIIITTHYMEEADVLGDRVAIMDHGQLVCYGTSMFLKREFGAGYHLTIIGSDKVQAITDLIQKKISTATLHSSIGTNLNYLLPHEMKSSFSGLLAELEDKKSSLGITNISISITTLEEVFLSAAKAPTRVGGNTSATNNDLSFGTNPPPKSTGVMLFLMQVWGLFKKRWYFLYHQWLRYLVLMTILLFITLFELSMTTMLTSTYELELNLKMYGRTTVYYGGNDSVTKMEEEYSNIVKAQRSTPIRVKSVSNEIIKTAKENIARYSQFLVVGAEFNTSSKTVNAMYSEIAYHSSAISLNLLMNAMLKGIMGDKYSIHVTNFPQAGISSGDASVFEMFQWKFFFPFGLSILTTMFLQLPVTERISNVKQLQLMCGVRSVTYWSVCYLFDLILYCMSIAVVMLFIYSYGQFNPEYVEMGNRNIVLILWLTYGLTTIPVIYLFSYKKSVGAATTHLILLNLFGSIIAVLFEILTKYEELSSLKTFHSVFTIYPPYGISRMAANVSEKKILCMRPTYDRDDESKKNSFCSDSYFEGKYSITDIYLTVIYSGIAYFVILLLFECDLFVEVVDRILSIVHAILGRILGRSNDSNDNDDSDASDDIDSLADKKDIKDETNRIANTLTEEQQNIGRANEYEERTASELLLVYRIKKSYGRHKVVKGVSFAVNPGDCFGLLGVNGAGKTTIFRILSGDLPLTTGEARIITPTNERVYLSKQPKKYLENVGYCPQYDAINEFLTGRQMLKLFAQLRGISKGAKDEVEKYIIALGLKEFAEKPCGHYSGGNKRKLNVAISLIGQPALIMLDEPTSGVDPVSRRKLWNILSALNRQNSKTAIILTSHSMDECEALCARLAIMKEGQLECCGMLTNLKQKYGQGFTVMLKVAPTLSVVVQTPDTNTTNKSQDEVHPQVKEVMLAFEQKYKDCCTLKDHHPGLLHYHINDASKKWSQLFSEIEALKVKYPVIEDYNINETSLEDIFLSIARAKN